MSSLVRLLNRIKLHRDVFGVYSKVDILHYFQNGKIEGLHLKKAILLNETYQRQSALRMQSVFLQNNGRQLRSEERRRQNTSGDGSKSTRRSQSCGPWIHELWKNAHFKN